MFDATSKDLSDNSDCCIIDQEWFGPEETAALEKAVDTLRLECAKLQVRNRELLRALSDGTAAADLLIACEQKCATLQGQKDERTTEPLKKAAITRGASAASAASAGMSVEDPPLPGPSGLTKLSVILRSSGTAVHACLAELGPEVDFEQASDEELDEMRQIRSCAAALAVQGIAIMIMYFGALRQSMLRRVHVATYFPRQAGGLDAAADAVLPTIARVFFRSRLLQRLLPSVWFIGVTCYFCVAFDRFEHGSAEEWLACAASGLMLPVAVCIVASLNAKTVRSLLREFQTLYVLVNVLAFMCLVLFLFRDHSPKMLCVSLSLPSLLLAGFLDAYVEGCRVLSSCTFFTLNIA